jgi:hypothetical protein
MKNKIKNLYKRLYLRLFHKLSTIEITFDDPTTLDATVRNGKEVEKRLQDILGVGLTKRLLDVFFIHADTKEEGYTNFTCNIAIYQELDNAQK